MARVLDDPSSYSLADFHHGDGPDPLSPPEGFTAWRAATRWATSVYEPRLAGSPVPRTALAGGGTARPILNFASYNYLGLATHPETVAAAQRALAEYGTGACGSPILSGMTSLHAELEQRLARFLGRESVMLFNSGFGGALGSLAGALRKGDVAVMDEKVHFSLIEGAKLSQARAELFAHDDPASLDAVLERTRGKRRVLVLEGVYSMDGDMADLPALLPVAEAHGVPVFIDEAHSILVTGASGRGAGEHFGVEPRIKVQYGTFSKALAAAGGFTSGPRETIDYLRMYATPYGYSCALPPSVVASVLAGLEVATRDGERRKRLEDNARYFREGLRSAGADIGRSTTQVVPIIIGDDRPLLYELTHRLLEAGLFLAPVDYPSVPQDQVRFRASVTAAHTREDLDRALDIISEVVVRRIGRRP